MKGILYCNVFVLLPKTVFSVEGTLEKYVSFHKSFFLICIFAILILQVYYFESDVRFFYLRWTRNTSFAACTVLSFLCFNDLKWDKFVSVIFRSYDSLKA